MNAVALKLNITRFYSWTNDEKIINDSLLSTMNYLAASCGGIRPTFLIKLCEKIPYNVDI